MNLFPRDLDFKQPRHAAAREIALAIGVPPMLLGIPGDNTYSNYAEANRAFWRMSVLPLVQRTARALSGWLAPAWGGELRLAPDLDAVEALAPEREALWKRVGAAGFLSQAEKREAVGYGEGGRQGIDARGIRKFNPYHDEQGRFTFAPDEPRDDAEATDDDREDPATVHVQADDTRAQAERISREEYASAFSSARTQLGDAAGYGAATNSPVSTRTADGFTAMGMVYLNGPRGSFSITPDPGWALEVFANRDGRGAIAGFTITPVPSGF